MRRLRDVAGEVRAFMNEATVLGDRLGPVLFQCPPTVEYDEPLLAAFADGLPPGIAAVMEFRHASWRAAWPFLAERRHRPLCCRYRRRRCRRGRAGLAAVRVPAPATRVLQRLRAGHVGGRIQAALDDGGDVYCYFKHEDSAAGPRMARRLEQLMDGDSRK